MSQPGGAEPRKSGPLELWCKDAFATALTPGRELRRGQRAFVIAMLMLALLFIYVFGFIAAWVIMAIFGHPLEAIPGAPSVVLPQAYVSFVVITFVIYLVISHLSVIFVLADFGKPTLQAIEYMYLFVGALGLAGIAGVGIERAHWYRQMYVSSIENIRSSFDFYLRPAEASLCGQQVPRLRSVPVAEICQWMEEAKSLAHQPIDRNESYDKERVDKLIEASMTLRAKIPSAARARLKDIVADREKQVPTIPDEVVYDITENQRYALRMLESMFENGLKENFFDKLLELGGQINKIDAELPKDELSFDFKKPFGFILIAFAIALRITKLTTETFGIGPR